MISRSGQVDEIAQTRLLHGGQAGVDLLKVLWETDRLRMNNSFSRLPSNWVGVDEGGDIGAESTRTSKAALEMTSFARVCIEDRPQPIAAVGQWIVGLPFMDEQGLAGFGHGRINVYRGWRSPAQRPQADRSQSRRTTAAHQAA